MNTLYTKVSSVREQLILFAGQMESLEQDYNTVVAELENSFVDSKGHCTGCNAGVWTKRTG